MYTAAAGMAAQQRRLDATANDLANINTTGYKRVRVAFRDLVYDAAGPGGAPGVQTGAGAAASIVGRSQVQGALLSTGQPLDLGISGPGFFQVRLQDGRTALTRDGAMGIDGQGNLRMHTGELLQPPVKVPAGTDPDRVAVQSDGRVVVDGREVGRIRLVDVPAPGALEGGPNNTFVPTNGSGAVRAAAPTTAIQQGVLEGSNTDAAEAMTGMIESQRAFQLASKAIQTQDQLLEIANGIKR